MGIIIGREWILVAILYSKVQQVDPFGENGVPGESFGAVRKPGDKCFGIWLLGESYVHIMIAEHEPFLISICKRCDACCL
ncbi:hypothetical protein D3C76_1347020 [compost metagenome]